MPASSSAAGVVTLPASTWLISTSGKFGAKKQWEKDRSSVIAYVDGAIPIAKKALCDFDDDKAKAMLLSGIARLERMKALALSAVPAERPWLPELKLLADESPRLEARQAPKEPLSTN
jgi:hypothetical protein